MVLDFRFGSKGEMLGKSTCFPLLLQQRTSGARAVISELSRAAVAPDLTDLLCLVAFEHGRQRDFQDFADAIEARRTDPVDATFIFLNLLERDTQ